MPKKLMMLWLAAPALALGGCVTNGTENRGLESVHQPVVSRSEFLFDANVDGGRLSEAELRRLLGWMETLRVTYGDRIAVDDPSGGTTARAQVAALAGEYGLFLEPVPPITTSAVAPGTVRVIITRSVATVPGCPDYSRNGTAEFNSNTSSNHGCAINSNIAAMVARPEDLVRGRPGAPTSDPATSTKAIQALRKAASASGGALKAESAGGK